jgi:enamine deaminase RidA (YjgF/YER057c/UK114 family)
VASYSHGAVPIPAASRIGPFVATGNIGGFDFAAGCYPAEAPAQVRMMFDNLRAILAGAGVTLADVLKMTVYVQDNSYRKALDVEWLRAFPDPDSLPARQTLLFRDLPPGRLVACEVLAVAAAAPGPAISTPAGR